MCMSIMPIVWVTMNKLRVYSTNEQVQYLCCVVLITIWLLIYVFLIHKLIYDEQTNSTSNCYPELYNIYSKDLKDQLD